MRAYDWERAPIDVETPEVVPARVMKGMVMVREPVSEEVGRVEPMRAGMREKILVSEEELDVVPNRGVVRWRRAEVVERGDVEPRREKMVERMLDAVDRADEEPDRVTTPTRDRSPEIVEVPEVWLMMERRRRTMAWVVEAEEVAPVR